MIRKILSSTENPLRQKSKTVRKMDKKVLSLIKDLKDTLAAQKDPEGVGLAAPQIGKNLKIFVYISGGNINAIINPVVINIKNIKERKKKEKIMEGCLSIPYYYGPLKRPNSIKIKYLDERFQKKEQTFTGFTAQIIQHEIDHLEGVLFVDRLLEQKKPLYLQTKDGWEEVELLP